MHLCGGDGAMRLWSIANAQKYKKTAIHTHRSLLALDLSQDNAYIA